jgi:hypothetical protein
MSSRSLSDIQTRAEAKARVCISDINSSDANVLTCLTERPILWVHWWSNFKNKHCLTRENQSWNLCKSGQIFIRFTCKHWLLNIHFFCIFLVNYYEIFKEWDLSLGAFILWILKIHKPGLTDNLTVFVYIKIK